MGVRPTHFQIGTIIITLDLPSESHHRILSSPLFITFLLSYFTRIFSIRIIQYRLNVDPYTIIIIMMSEFVKCKINGPQMCSIIALA